MATHMAPKTPTMPNLGPSKTQPNPPFCGLVLCIAGWCITHWSVAAFGPVRRVLFEGTPSWDLKRSQKQTSHFCGPPILRPFCNGQKRRNLAAGLQPALAVDIVARPAMAAIHISAETVLTSWERIPACLNRDPYIIHLA